ncbi:hypothetical protein DPEC_G00099100, partial [Dallia pectoralis]
EFIRIKAGITYRSSTGYWIGLTDLKVKGVWVWMDNTTVNGNIKYWDMNVGNGLWTANPEPNNWPPGEDCAILGWRCAVEFSCWNDSMCNLPANRICESRANT